MSLRASEEMCLALRCIRGSNEHCPVALITGATPQKKTARYAAAWFRSSRAGSRPVCRAQEAFRSAYAGAAGQVFAWCSYDGATDIAFVTPAGALLDLAIPEHISELAPRT